MKCYMNVIFYCRVSEHMQLRDMCISSIITNQLRATVIGLHDQSAISEHGNTNTKIKLSNMLSKLHITNLREPQQVHTFCVHTKILEFTPTANRFLTSTSPSNLKVPEFIELACIFSIKLEKMFVGLEICV